MDEKYTVCIGRQYGSGGREVGALVAEKLGVTCYDKLLIQEAARKSGMDETFLKNNEERLTEVLLPFSGNTFADEAIWPVCSILPERMPTAQRSRQLCPLRTGNLR